MVLFIGLVEIGFETCKEEIEKVHLEKSKRNAATIRKKKPIELNNGRAAMMGIIGLTVHEKFDVNPHVLNAMLGSPVTFN